MAPAIVFIDEIDAIGARREASADGNREREQTLNQILIELDGFRARDSVIVMAATNRPEILDSALVRAGRFDREITVCLPDRQGRRDILQVHVGHEAPRTGRRPRRARRHHARPVGRRPRERHERGRPAERPPRRATRSRCRRSRRRSSARRWGSRAPACCPTTSGGPSPSTRPGTRSSRRSVPEGSLPHMISVIPAGRSLGRAWMTDTHDRLVYSRSAMIDEMAILLGGRAPSSSSFGQAGSSGQGDLAEVGRIAHRMVRELGMSDAVGPIGYPGRCPTTRPGADVLRRDGARDRRRGTPARRRGACSARTKVLPRPARRARAHRGRRCSSPRRSRATQIEELIGGMRRASWPLITAARRRRSSSEPIASSDRDREHAERDVAQHVDPPAARARPSPVTASGSPIVSPPGRNERLSRMPVPWTNTHPW